MRRRILAVLLAFAVFAVVAFAVPLAFATASARTRELRLDRNADATYFAAVARRTGDGIVEDQLQAELDRYSELYDEGVLIVDTRGGTRAAADLEKSDPGVAEAITAALRNQRQEIGSSLTPWSDVRELISVPVGTGAHVDGAVVLEVSTAVARRDIRNAWIAILAGAFTALTVVTVLATTLARWIVRPLDLLTRRIVELTASVPRAAPFRAEIDVTPSYQGPPEVRQLARSFDTMSEAVRSSTRAQRQLVADTAHKLRNPLAALQIRLDSLSVYLPDTAMEGYRRASTETDRLGEILDALLTLAAAEVPDAGDDAEGAEQCGLDSVVADRADAWVAALDDEEMSLVVGRGLHVRVNASADRMAQVLDILLSNSCRYAGRGATVTIDAHREDGRIRLAYRDDGIGVPADEVERLTERFYRGSTPDKTGTGLGLSIAGALVGTVGGRLELRTSHPHGLCIDVVLPAYAGGPGS